MIASSHLSTGAAIGAFIFRFLPKLHWSLSLPIALILGILSHFLLDIIPHSEAVLYGNKIGLGFWLTFFLELVITFCLIYFLGFSKSTDSFSNLIIVIAMIGAAIPDLPAIFNSIFKVNWSWLNSLNKINTFFHYHGGSNLFLGGGGLLSQILLSIFALFILKSLLK